MSFRRRTCVWHVVQFSLQPLGLALALVFDAHDRWIMASRARGKTKRRDQNQLGKKRDPCGPLLRTHRRGAPTDLDNHFEWQKWLLLGNFAMTSRKCALEILPTRPGQLPISGLTQNSRPPRSAPHQAGQICGPRCRVEPGGREDEGKQSKRDGDGGGSPVHGEGRTKGGDHRCAPPGRKSWDHAGGSIRKDAARRRASPAVFRPAASRAGTASPMRKRRSGTARCRPQRPVAAPAPRPPSLPGSR